jgi:hypothetical protein
MADHLKELAIIGLLPQYLLIIMIRCWWPYEKGLGGCPSPEGMKFRRLADGVAFVWLLERADALQQL